jgi:hypothetical protein
MFGKEYNVVFEYTSEFPCLEGLRFLAKYPQKSYFEISYTPEVMKRQMVIATGVSHAHGLKMVHEIPIEKYYEGLILSAYDSDKKIIDLKKFDSLLEVLITARNGVSKHTNEKVIDFDI